MRRRKRALSALSICSFALLLLSLTPIGVQAQSGHKFDQTGFTVPDTFYNYWQQNGGLEIFGYPISEARQEGGFLVQYFERNRFELHPENAGTDYEVQLGLLGVIMTEGRNFLTVQATADTDDLKYVPETGHTLGGAFLRYYNAHGGLRIFGYPISQEIQENGYTVQYFQRNRFEFHAENAGTDHQVLLGLLGRDYLALQQRGQLPASGSGSSNAPAGPAPTTAPGSNTAPTPTATAKNAPAGYAALTLDPNKGPHVGYGMIVHMYYQDHDRILNMVQDMGFNWVKQQVVWADTEPNKGDYQWYELDRIVDSVQRHGLNILLSVVRSPDWASSTHGYPDNPDDFGHFMQVISDRYKGKVGAYEIWNEQNLAIETAGHHKNPELYAALLEAGFKGARAGDPNAVVLSGALAPTGVYTKDAYEDTWYLEQLYKWNNGELRNYFDAVASHPYGYWNPPDTMFPVKKPSDQTPAAEYKNHGSFYFRRVEDQRAIMEKYGDNIKQMWVTEFGWCSDQRDGGYVECLNNSLDDQAKYLVRTYQMSKENYPWMGVMFAWNLNFSTFQEWYTGPSHFSIINGDWSPRPAFWALKNMPK